MMRNFGNVFSTLPGKCFRFVTDGFGRPGQCIEQVVVRGIFEDERGERFEVDACEFHAHELREAAPVNEH
jgi:hypothetical protein